MRRLGGDGPGTPPDDVRRILVLRPNALGDFIFALPALQALRLRYPAAEIVYLGLSWHAQFLSGRPGPVDRVEVLPPVPGIQCPETAAEPAEVEAFCARLRSERFDLALQLYGGGRYANPLVRRFGARLTIGMQAPGAPALDRCLHYEPLQNERLRLLEVAALAGAPAVPAPVPLRLRDQDRREAAAVVQELRQPLVVLQPGARDPRRRWPVERFAALGDVLARMGHSVAVHGSAAEAALVRAVIAAMRAPALDLAGRLSIGGLAGLLDRTALMVSNDTGPLHLADAVGCPAVGLYWFTNAFVSAPLQLARHRQLVSLQIACPQCGADNRFQRCGHDPSFIADIPPEAVLEAARGLLQGERTEAAQARVA